MSHSSEEIGPDFWHLLKILEKLQRKPLTEWEQDFVDDMTESLNLWGEKTFISGKQYAKLEQIEDDYL